MTAKINQHMAYYSNVRKKAGSGIYLLLTIICSLLISKTSLQAQTVTIANNATVVVATGATGSTPGSMVIDAGGAIDNSGTLSLEGDWTNNGLGLIGGSPGTVLFDGNNPLQTISGTSSTAFNAIAIDKGTSSSNICEVTGAGISLPAAGNLSLINGTFKLSGTFSFSNRLFFNPNYNIPATTGVWINNPNATVTGQNGTATVAGMLKLSSGNYSVGNSSDNSLHYNSGAQIIINGGSLNIAGTLSPTNAGIDAINYSQTAGNVTVVKQGSLDPARAGFDVTTGSSFTMSGGNIILQNATAATNDYSNAAGSFTVTGGTTQFGNASTPASTVFRINTLISLYNLTINNTNTPALNLTGGNCVVSNVLNMSGGNIDCGAFTLQLGTSTAVTGSLSYTSGNIIGNFKRYINATGTDILFPVGTAINNNSATVTFSDLNAGALTGKFNATDGGNAGLPLEEGAYNVTNQFTEGYWSLSASDGLTSTNYDLQLSGNGFTSYTEDADVRIIKRTNAFSNWTLDGTHVPAVANTAKRNGLSGFSEFAHASTTLCTPAVADAGDDQTICATGGALLDGNLSGSATSGTWSGGAGTFTPDASTLNATYTPTAGEITAGSVVLTLTTNDPAGACDATFDQVTISIDPAFIYYADADGDGFGNAGSTVTNCSVTPPVGYVTNNSDCNDASFTYNDGDGDGFGFGAAVACGAVTNNSDCNDALITYTDNDGDGFGVMPMIACGSVSNNTDCDDAQFLYVDIDGDGFGSGTPVACGVANNSDCFPLDITYLDGDGDGYGSATIAPCGVINNTDCNDAAFTYADIDGDGFGSGSPQSCGVTNNSDCFPSDITYTDSDGDGYGTLPMIPCGSVTNSLDCNDGLVTYTDADGDGFGFGSPAACGVANNSDCNDAAFTYNDADGDGFGFGSAVACGLVMNNSDCNDALITYTDGDGDGHGAGAASACGVASNDDCDDAEPAAYPGNVEICDGIDNDCDGDFDEGTVTATVTPSGTVQICKSNPLTLNANTGAGYTYQWYKNGNIILGAVSSSFIVTKAGDYQVQVNIPEGCFALSANTTVNTYPSPNANVSAPNGTSLCTTVKLKASYDASYAWQWKKAGVPVAGATNYLYFPTTAGNYTCTITNNFGCFRTSSAISVTACKAGETVESASTEIFDMYPNPADQSFNVEMEIHSDATEANIQIFNMVGEEVYTQTTGINNGTIDAHIVLGDVVPSGLYIVKVTVAEKEYTKQLVIQK